MLQVSSYCLYFGPSAGYQKYGGFFVITMRLRLRSHSGSAVTLLKPRQRTNNACIQAATFFRIEKSRRTRITRPLCIMLDSNFSQGFQVIGPLIDSNWFSRGHTRDKVGYGGAMGSLSQGEQNKVTGLSHGKFRPWPSPDSGWCSLSQALPCGWNCHSPGSRRDSSFGRGV